MNIRKTIKMLIVGLVIMGLASIGMAWDGNDGRGFDSFGNSGWWKGYEMKETAPETAEEEETITEAELETDKKEHTTSETAENEEIVADAESESEPIEEEEHTDEDVI